MTLDLHGERAKQRQGDTGVTPATSLIVAADVGFARLLEEGLAPRWGAVRRLNDAVLAAGVAMGARPFAERPSPAVAALATPSDVDADAVVRALGVRGFTVAGGQDRLKGRIVRPSVMGDVDRYDVFGLVAALEDAFRDVAVPVAFGSAIAAAMASWVGGDAAQR